MPWNRVHVLLRANQSQHGQIRGWPDLWQYSQSCNHFITPHLFHSKYLTFYGRHGVLSCPSGSALAARMRETLCFGEIILQLHADLHEIWSLEKGLRRIYDFTNIEPRRTVSTVSRTFTCRASGQGFESPFCSLFISRMRSAWMDHGTLLWWRHLIFLGTTWVMMPKSITSSSIPEFFNVPSTAMIHPLRDRVLAS